MQKKKKKRRRKSRQAQAQRILVALGVFAVVYALDELGALTIAFGGPATSTPASRCSSCHFDCRHDVLQRAFNNIRRGKAFDGLLMAQVATIGAFAVALPDTDPHMAEGAAVMLFYQVGELFPGIRRGQEPQVDRVP